MYYVYPTPAPSHRAQGAFQAPYRDEQRKTSGERPTGTKRLLRGEANPRGRDPFTRSVLKTTYGYITRRPNAQADER